MIIKRLIDIIGSFLGLILLFPILIIISFIIRLRMGKPIFFTQIRTGLNGEPFKIYKFRTMVMNHGGISVSVDGEKRITPFGIKLRKYKLDELPEFWNVLIGDMSLVGPRPDMPEYADKLKGEERLILALRPGMTGPASLKYANEEVLLASVSDPIKYNNEVIWPDKVRLNLYYYHNRSLWRDIYYLWRTILYGANLLIANFKMKLMSSSCEYK
ncbi:MAG: sugar transferase [Bacteroidales bacterium]|nr:sugar transferase [Bacteroidales bacterium]